MEISKIYQEEWHMTKYYMIRHLKLLVIQIMITFSNHINGLQILQAWSTNFLITGLGILVTGTKISENEELTSKLHNPINRKCQGTRYSHLIKITFVVLVLQMYS